MFLYRYFRPFLFQLPPEYAHNLALHALRFLPKASPYNDPRLEQQIAGLFFRNPIGLAAGFDKNAEALHSLARQNFGFIEAGTVTPKPQAGNPKPRLFRLSEDGAIINRMGFNNKGLHNFSTQLRHRPQGLIIGANIGKNKDALDQNSDYLTCLEGVFPYADYVTVNVSSPNTPGLRALQQKEALTGLLSAIIKTRNILSENLNRKVPVFLKIAPDIEPQDETDIAEVLLSTGTDGLIVCNTTITRPMSLKSKYASESGGLSGSPLFERSTAQLKRFRRLLKGNIPLIGVGGVASANDAYLKFRAGADLVAIYSGLIYEGFSLIPRILSGLSTELDKEGVTSITDIIGIDA
jgi:dihydroorotate dehydrogenase